MILELCKGVHCVDLDESFQSHIYLQNLASIQPSCSGSNITIVNLFVPLRYLQFLKIIRSTAAAAENGPLKVCKKKRKLEKNVRRKHRPRSCRQPTRSSCSPRARPSSTRTLERCFCDPEGRGAVRGWLAVRRMSVRVH